MPTRICANGHRFEKSSSCPVCPKCSANEMDTTFGQEFPPIGAPAFRALDAAGIKKLSDLTAFTEKELLALHGFGPRALKMLKPILAALNLALKK